MKKLTKPTIILIVFVVLNLILGVFIAGDFGRSTDETSEFNRASVAVQIYFGEINYDLDQAYEDLGHVRFYGTAATSLIHMVERILFPNTDHGTKAVAHYFYFVYFQLAVIGLYLLGNHFYSQWTSLGVAMLFATQPLLFGHGLMNPKDIPLMAVFLLTVAAGFKMVDVWVCRAHAEPSGRVQPKGKVIRFWIALVLLLLVLWTRGLVTDLVLNLVDYAYTSGDSSLAGKLFASLTSTGSLEGYLVLAQIYLSHIFRALTFLSPLLLFLLFRKAKRDRLFGRQVTYWGFLAAAIWGFAISTRVIAVAAGGIVGLYALIKLRQKAVIPLTVYTLSAGIFSYLTWPFLWVSGLGGYFASLETISDFPWTGRVLFEGQLYYPRELPARYLPKLMGLQFTEPLVVLALIGLLAGVYLLLRKKVDAAKLSLLYAWFLLPMLYVIIKQPMVYSNFRHFLFTIPPMFVFAGLALQPILDRLKKPVWQALLLALILLPGVIAIVQFHPYEYIYYNSFTGGMAGAYTQYEMDYWGLAYKDAMDYINENAPSGSRIIVWKNNRNGEIYASGDFSFSAHTELSKEEMQAYDYVIVPAGRSDWFDFLEGTRIVYTAGHGAAKFIDVLEIPD